MTLTCQRRSGLRSEFASNPAVASALRSGDPARIEGLAGLAAQNGLRSLVIRDPSGKVLATIGQGGTVATFKLNLPDRSGTLVASLTASTTTGPTTSTGSAS